MPSVQAETLFANRLQHMGGSAIREMLKVAGLPGFISFAGGLPAPESFPVGVIEELRAKTLKKYGPNLLQYGKTEGFDPLVKVLPEFLSRPNRQVKATPETIVVTSGSQEALNILGMMLIDPGSKVAVEAPTYLGALQAFTAYEPNYIEIATDREGIVPERLEEVFVAHPDLKFIYTIPTFQNPSGVCMSLDRRVKVAKLLQKYGKLAIEDDPYSELRYDGEHLPSLQSLAPDNVVHLFTFSKTLSPDFRVGGMVAPGAIRDKAVMIKQGASLFTSNQHQAVVAEYLSGHYIDKQIPLNIELYRPRRDAMVRAVRQYFPEVFEVNNPEGGMFLFAQVPQGATLPNGFRLEDVFAEAVEQKIGFVSGAPFYAYPGKAPVSMRLNFTNQTVDNIEKGIQILGSLLHKHMGRSAGSASIIDNLPAI